MAVPSNKIFTIGGDYVAVERTYGRAFVAHWSPKAGSRLRTPVI
ncbi:hypothetical protein [Bradyrhizobium arachidis]|nr:hypothetical protein [Bradyrhizobium arachidis]